MALERSQPRLPLKMGYVRTATHDYIRHGTATLFAALNDLDGKLIRQTAARHTHKQWLDFLKQIDRETPEELTLHIVLDNYSPHKHAKVRAWLKKRNREHDKKHKVERRVMHPDHYDEERVDSERGNGRFCVTGFLMGCGVTVVEWLGY